MKTLTKLFTILALLLVPTLALGQTNTLFGTTLSAAITNSQNSFSVASVAHIVPTTNTYNTDLFVDAELMVVVSQPSGTTVNVLRGQGGTKATAHVASSVVIIGKPAWFYAFDPQGACTAASTLVGPVVNYKNGQQWICSTKTLTWVPGFGNPGTSYAPIQQTADVATATATAITGPLAVLTSNTTITSFTFPAWYPTGAPFCLVPDNTPTITAGNNVA